jgi:hypothetical protein
MATAIDTNNTRCAFDVTGLLPDPRNENDPDATVPSCPVTFLRVVCVVDLVDADEVVIELDDVHTVVIAGIIVTAQVDEDDCDDDIDKLLAVVV